MQQGVFHIDHIRATQRLTQLGGVTSSGQQLVANKLDAGSHLSKIFWDPRKKRMIYLDFGHGILGEISKHDFEQLEFFAKFPEDIDDENNALVNFERITSALSYDYMMKSAGYSVKSHPEIWGELIKIIGLDGKKGPNREYELTQGIFGIGFLEPFGIADSVTIVSRPHIKLASYHYGREFKDYSEVPVWALRPLFDFENRKLGYEKYEFTEEFVMPYSVSREPITHGTMIILEGVNAPVSLDRLKQTLQETFGLIIGSGAFNIEIIEVKTDKRRSKNPHSLKIKKVPPLKLEGRPLNLRGQKTLEFSVGKLRALVSLYDVGKEGQIRRPSFVRRGAIAGEVTNLDGFEGAWFHNRLTGTVEIITPGDDSSYWTAQKQYPSLNKKDMARLVAMISDLEADIAERFEEIDAEREESRLSSIQDLASQALAKALKQTDYFAGLAGNVGALLWTDESEVSTKPSAVDPRQNISDEQLLTVTVYNEHFEKSRHDIAFDIHHPFGLYTSGQTTRGKFSFEVSDKDEEYDLVLTITDLQGADLQSGQETMVVATKKPGQSINFDVYLITGESKRKRAFSGLEIMLIGFGSPDDPWDAADILSSKLIRINTDYAPLADALADNDYRSIAHMIASSATAAIACTCYDPIEIDVIKAMQRVKDDSARMMIRNWKNEVTGL